SPHRRTDQAVLLPRSQTLALCVANALAALLLRETAGELGQLQGHWPRTRAVFPQRHSQRRERYTRQTQPLQSRRLRLCRRIALFNRAAVGRSEPAGLVPAFVTGPKIVCIGGWPPQVPLSHDDGPPG